MSEDSGSLVGFHFVTSSASLIWPMSNKSQIICFNYYYVCSARS